MANVSFWSTTWEGSALHPGGAHTWWLVRSDWDEASLLTLRTQVNVTTHPGVFSVKTPPPPVELTVQDLRSHITGDYSRVVYFTVRNTGPNPVVVYTVGVSFVDE